jgi:hypothetical protein
MKSIKTLAKKPLPPSEGPPSDARATTSKGSSTGQPSVIKLPAELMEQLFPEHNVMISAVFDGPDGAGAPLPAEAAELPQSEPQPMGKLKEPGVLSISDELMETIFPKQKVMISVLFHEKAPEPATPEPVRRAASGDSSNVEHDFPIV